MRSLRILKRKFIFLKYMFGRLRYKNGEFYKKPAFLSFNKFYNQIKIVPSCEAKNEETFITISFLFFFFFGKNFVTTIFKQNKNVHFIYHYFVPLRKLEFKYICLRWLQICIVIVTEIFLWVFSDESLKSCFGDFWILTWEFILYWWISRF